MLNIQCIQDVGFIGKYLKRGTKVNVFPMYLALPFILLDVDLAAINNYTGERALKLDGDGSKGRHPYKSRPSLPPLHQVGYPSWLNLYYIMDVFV